MSDEEPDYMSDDFLASITQNNDVRPGLPRSHRQERERQMLEKKKKVNELHKKSQKSTESLQSERLQQGLNEPISHMNKGFSLLQKMGFKPGTGLGKTNSGMVEPVAINIKNNKHGLGRDEVLKRIKQQKKDIKLKHGICEVDEYRDFLSKKNKEQEVNSDIRKSQRVCYGLDAKNDVNIPIETWFWPFECLPKKEKNEDEENLEMTEIEVKEEVEEEEEEDNTEYAPEEQLEILTSYLRYSYCYCVWCGVQYDDDRDLQQDCPGSTRGDH